MLALPKGQEEVDTVKWVLFMGNQILGEIYFVVPTKELVHLSSRMLFFTDSGIIVTDLGGKYMTELFLSGLAGATAGDVLGGGGFKGGAATSIGSISAMYLASEKVKKQVDEAIAKMLEYGPDFILKDNKSNFLIAYPDIISLELKRGGWFAHTNITIVTSDKKHSFDITGTHGFRTKNMVDDSEFASYLEIIKKTGINDKLSLK